jgi:hypothetical protein
MVAKGKTQPERQPTATGLALDPFALTHREGWECTTKDGRAQARTCLVSCKLPAGAHVRPLLEEEPSGNKPIQSTLSTLAGTKHGHQRRVLKADLV